ncbi:MAG: ACP phosphodiesterase [Cytophagaceae bacterium]
MNFLAHLYLSGEPSDLMVGNFIADSIRGKEVQTFSEDIQKGIILHRFIDHFTDTHPVTHDIKLRIQEDFHKYNAVVVDLYYDHFLSKHWSKFHPTPIEEYAAMIYQFMQQQPNMPERVEELLPYMMKQNWLVNYANFDGLQRVFNGMSRRANFTSNMEKGIEVLQREYDFLEEAFFTYFPQLEVACKEKIEEIYK